MIKPRNPFRCFNSSPEVIRLGIALGGRLVENYGSRPPLLLGPSVTAIGYGILGLSGGDPRRTTKAPP